MIRIGIIGTESTHAMAFAKFFNTPDEHGIYRYENIRVTVIAGCAEDNAKICNSVDVAYQMQNYEEMLGQVDAVMITTRRGSEHYAQAIPFIEHGIPVFLDKPFTADLTQGEKLLELILKGKSLVMGGSGCKYAPEIQKLKEKVRMLRENEGLLSASMGFTSMDSPYDGFWFYAPHLVEMALEAFGYDPLFISANENKNGILAMLQYADVAVSLHFDKRLPDASYTLYTTYGTEFSSIDISEIYMLEADRFAQMLLHGKLPQPMEGLADHVRVIDAIQTSCCHDGRPVMVKRR